MTSPAVRRALGYYRVTGTFPSHIHLDTWSAAHKMLVYVPHVVCGVDIQRGVLNAEAIELTDRDPMWLAARYLMNKGFKSRDRYRAGRRTSHYIPFERFIAENDTVERGLAYREGGGSITTPIHAEGSGVFIRNETVKFSLADTQ